MDLNFKAGLEIHQQLDGKKLFCTCSAINSDKKPNLKVIRKLRAVIGETGMIDSAASHETEKNNEFTYIGNSEDTCLVEFDEEPPHNPNIEHIKTAIMVSKMLNAELIDELQIMRKNVVDGSNVSGFQRTILVARNGFIETSKGMVKIPTILLEEEAAQKIKSTDKTKTYKLDRLGIALLEISTDASIKDPDHAQEVASLLGMILRSTEKVKRGLGTIRQDVNLSIKGLNRVEIKGFQDLKSIPKVIKNEINRQLELLKNNKKIVSEVRKAESDLTTTFLRPMPDSSRLYPETDCLPIKITEKMKKIKLPKLLIEREADLEKLGLSNSMAKQVLKQGIDLKDYKFDLPIEFIANVLITIPKDIQTRLKISTNSLKKEDFIEVLNKVTKKEVTKDSIIDILALKAEGKSIDYNLFKPVDENEITKVLKKIVSANPNQNIGAYMGEAMKELKGKVEGNVLMKLLKKIIE